MLLQVYLHAAIAARPAQFDIEDVAERAAARRCCAATRTSSVT